MRKNKEIESTGCLDAAGQSHYNVCEIFVQFAIAFYIVRIIMAIVNVIYAGVQPDITITTGGGYYEFDLPLGICRMGQEYLPAGTQIPDNKTVCIGFLLSAVVFDFVPMLFVLNLIRKILRTFDKSHSPFVPETVVYVKKAGKILILIGVFSELAMKSIVWFLVFHNLSPFALPGDMQTPWIFAGVIVLLVSDIFRRGCELQQFSDETL